MTMRHHLYKGGWSAAIVREVFVRGAAAGVVRPSVRLNRFG